MTTVFYGLILKSRIFKLGGFIIKKTYKKLDNENLLFFFKNNKLSNIILNPALSLIQVLNVFKYYISFVLDSRNSVIAILLNRQVVTLPVNNFSKANYYTVSNFIGDLFSNFFVSSWFLVHSSNPKLRYYPALCLILNYEVMGWFLRSLYNLSVPTVGFYNNNNEKCNYLTFPLFLDCNVYILYFVLRLFLRLLYILKIKL